MDRILLGHGSGGRMMHDLIRERIAPRFGITDLSDAAVLKSERGHRPLAFSTDSYVVSPLFFPGGNIGDLAVNGTVNDLSMAGARPLYLTSGFIIEEGLLFKDLDEIIASMSAAAERAGVKIVAGDLKVVERGKGDGIFINTSGIGIIPEGVWLSASNIRPGDKVLLSGPVGTHGIAVMAKRHGLSFDPPVLSDTAALNGLVEEMLAGADGNIRVMRDPTRGGLATALKELSLDSGAGFLIEEARIPVFPPVGGACELLGLDPLYVANEGVLLAVVAPHVAEYLLGIMRGNPLGRGSALIGEAAGSAAVILKTEIGGSRALDMLQGEQLPRIC